MFDLKKTYEFQTMPGIDQYNIPIYVLQSEPGGTENVSYYPVYQGLSPFCSVNGVSIPFYTQKAEFANWMNYIPASYSGAVGDGTTGPYTIQLSAPVIPGHVDMQGVIRSTFYNEDSAGINCSDPLFLGTTTDINLALGAIQTTSIKPSVYFVATDADGQNITVSDTGIFLNKALNTTGDLYGALMQPGKAPDGNSILLGGYTTSPDSNVINYNTGVATVTFRTAIPAGNPITAQSYYFNQGMPRAVLFHNNTLTLRNPPDRPYLVSLEGYLTPAAFISSQEWLPFAYMAEYIARGAARKMLTDTGDIEQFQFYEPLFREQEMLVLKRSQRIQTSTRTPTIYSQRRDTGTNPMQGAY